MEPRGLLLGLLAVLVRLGLAQESGWQDGQVNATMCQWQLPRGGIVRDTLYLDGGYLWWLPGMSDGTYGSATEDGNPLGLVYQLNFSIPFNTSANFSEIFTTLSIGGDSGQATNNLYPQYWDGVMFANDDEFYTYGGLLTQTDAYSVPDADAVEGYQKYQYGAYKPTFDSGFISGTLPSNLTRYVVGGGGVSIPSQNQGFYFAGMTSPSGGPIFYASVNQSENPSALSQTLISIDMSVQNSEVWTNNTLPDSIPGRANPELAWIPVSSQGALIGIGGVIYPEWVNYTQEDTTEQAAESSSQSPKFMETVAVYDIANATWYLQDTSGDAPSALTQGCSVVASAPDNSSHNIYWYGGFDGIDSSGDYSDDVYVLSIPSFIWVKLSSGDVSNGRAGHRCYKPYPDQMFVVGGYPTQASYDLKCAPEGLIRLFNLSNAEWFDSYDPTIWSNYTVPTAITDKIGGTSTGGATVTSPSSWANDSLATLFGTTYSQKITQWYPYTLANSTNTTRPDLPTATVTSSGGGTPSWLAPFLGVILGLIAISAIIVAFILWRKRQYLKRHGTSESGTSGFNRGRIMTWVFGTRDGNPNDEKLDETVTSITDDKNDIIFNQSGVGSATSVIEVPDTQVYELPVDSIRHELNGTSEVEGVGLTYVTTPNKLKSSNSQRSHTSRGSQVVSPVQSLQSLEGSRYRADSTGAISEDGTTTSRSRVISGISLTPSQVRHLRQDNGDTVSSEGDTPSMITPEEERDDVLARVGVASPVSPPTPPQGADAADYISSQGHGSTPGQAQEEGRRRSKFGEVLDDKHD